MGMSNGISLGMSDGIALGMFDDVYDLEPSIDYHLECLMK